MASLEEIVRKYVPRIEIKLYAIAYRFSNPNFSRYNPFYGYIPYIMTLIRSRLK